MPSPCTTARVIKRLWRPWKAAPCERYESWPAFDSSAVCVATVFGEHDGFEQLVIGCGFRIGPRRMVVAHGDRGKAARSARVKIEDADAITRRGVAAC